MPYRAPAAPASGPTAPAHHRPDVAAPLRPFPMGGGFHLRELDLTLSTAWHPRALEWEATTRGWMEDVLAGTGRDRPLLEACVRDAPWWACLCYPATVDEDRMADVLRVTICFFLMDDAIYTSHLARGSIGDLLEEFVQIWADPRARPATALGHFLAGTWRGMSRRMPPGLRERWIAATAAFADGTAREIGARADGRDLDPSAYRQMRDDSMAAAVVHLLGEYSTGLDMSQEIAARPERFTRIWQVANDHLLDVNDLLSFRKEYCDGNDFQHSLVYTGVTVDGLTLQQSVDRLCTRIEETERRFRALSQEFPEPRMRRYLRQVERGIAGSRDYSLIAYRYHGPGFARRHGGGYVPARTSGWLTLTPRRTSLTDGPAVPVAT
ncbi:terpene synthase family protein [Streptomyces abyssomicinicus]|uniref:terpene synthase family protein n=1 Tax=Streptomyces abyssomicinicus TaxID=574929 RepID=UPI00124FCE74|nr:terpene synthase family protein [Streptomyces abyssomicinicus]